MRLAPKSPRHGGAPTWAIFALFLGLVQCSETAMRSALYEPDFGESDVSRQTLPPQRPKSAPQDQDEDANADEEFSDSEPVRIFPAPTDADARASHPGTSKKSSTKKDVGLMKLSLKQKKILIQALWPEAKSTQVEVDSLRVELKEEKKTSTETFLSGYLIVKAGELEARHLPNQGLVVYTAAEEMDVMQAQFRVGREVALVLDMTRKASRTYDEGDRNAWSGTLSLIQGETRKKLGTLEGFVKSPRPDALK